MHDQAEQLVMDAEIRFAVLGKDGEFLLVDLAGEIESARAEAAAKGYSYCGVMGVRDGLADVVCANFGSIYTMMLASLAFARIVADRLKSQPRQNDFVKFAQSLYDVN